MKGRSSLLWIVGIIMVFLAVAAHASGVPSDKRTILTSGEKVYTIQYRLGQSTVLYFGLRPETVICGNKNYFNIEKIKDGITIQPLSNFSTNLTVLAQGKRFLFFLKPTTGRPDGFVEVKWVSPDEARPVRSMTSSDAETVRELGQKTKLSGGVELSILRERILNKGKRRVFEVELKNSGSQAVSTGSFEIVATLGGTPLARQVVVWESETLAAKGKLLGRVIVSDHAGKALSFIVGHRGRSTKIVVKSHRD